MIEPQDDDKTLKNATSAPPTQPAMSKLPLYSTSDFSSRRQAPPPPPMPYGSTARERAQRRRVTGGNRPSEWAWVVVAFALFAVVLAVSISAVVLVRANQVPIEVIPTADVMAFLPTAVVAHNEFRDTPLGESLILPDGSNIALTPWDGKSRFTMVLAGLDRRPDETGLGHRTDTLMVVSIDPKAQRIGILSIPRDLFVQVPGYAALQRVNSPMVFGESRQPGYGPTLLMQTIQLNLGIRINDYFIVDFQAFIDVVDTIGGITVTTDYTINDPQYPNMTYGYDPFYLPAGTHTLNGYNALRFARTRHGDSDINRAQRQQQTVMAVRDKVLKFDMLPQLILRSPELWGNLQNRIYTGLTLEQLIQLGLYVKDIPAENITMGVISYEYLIPYTTDDGASVLIPNRARLGGLMVNTFGADYTQ